MTFGVDLEVVHEVSCKLFNFLDYVLAKTSAWFLVAMTTQRVTSVAFPLRRVALLRQCTAERNAAVVVVVLILCACVLIDSGLLFMTGSIITVRLSDNDTVRSCSLGDIQNDAIFPFYSVEAYYWLDLALSSVVPFCILTSSNFLLAWKVTQSLKTIRRMTRDGSSQTQTRGTKTASSLSLTLVVTSVAFLLLTSPLPAYVLYSNLVHTAGFSVTKLDLARSVSGLLWFCNSAVNFFLYCLSGARFRREARRCLCRGLLPASSLAIADTAG